jgi:hypothetical protein
MAMMILCAGGRAGGDSSTGDARMGACVARLERARAELARSQAAFARAHVAVADGVVGLQLTDGDASYAVSVTATSPSSQARNNWNPPIDQWVDLPIIDKSYSLTKLYRFRFGARLEGTILASRADASPRAPPVPPWLRRYAEVFQRAIEDCLAFR